MFRIFLSFAFLIVLFGVSHEATPLTPGSKPEQRPLAGYLDAYCSSVPEKFVACRVRTNEDQDAKFVFLKDEKEIRSFEAPFWTLANAGPEDFVFYRGDLDSDGSNEFVLVSLEGVSNGMGISYATMYIFPDLEREPDANPAVMPIEEFGYADTLVFDRKIGRTLILASYWDSYASLDKRRGWGMYLVGKWFEYDKGRLAPQLNKPTLARRFLNAFAEERNNEMFPDRHPNTWLKHPTTNRFMREPVSGDKLVSTVSGKVTDFSMGGEQGCRLTIVTENEETEEQTMTTVTCGHATGGDRSDDATVRSIGLRPQHYIFPKNFDPTYYLYDLEGQYVSIQRFRDRSDREYFQVWIF
jgi:hypothetical protein